MLSNKLNFILTLVLTTSVFIYMKNKEPKGKGSLEKNTESAAKEVVVNNDHPLKHPKLNIISEPVGDWVEGNLDIHDAMAYIMSSDAERKLAIDALMKAGFGHEKTDFLYLKNGKITINGLIYNSVSEAKEYLQNSTIKKIRVFAMNKEDFPVEIKSDRIKFYMVPWDKRTLPNIEL